MDLRRNSVFLQICRLKWLAIAAAFVFVGTPALAETFKKCQDATGKWHYGDFAAAECERAKVTEIDKTGITVKEHKSAPTREELDAKKTEEQNAKEEAKKQAEIRRQERLLLNTYDSPDAIVRARDDRVIAIDREIATNNKLKEKFLAEAKQLAKTKDPKQQKRRSAVQEQIALFDTANEKLLKDRQGVIEHYNDLYIQYQTILQRNQANRK